MIAPQRQQRSFKLGSSVVARESHDQRIPPVQRALLVINRSSGTGQRDSVAETLKENFKTGLDCLTQVQVEFVSDHAAARTCAAEFISKSEAPALVVAGGGGGTLRAVIEGVCEPRAAAEPPGPERVRIGALRMGSGNLLAKQFGVPQDPILGLQGLLTNLQAGRTTPCCVMRCQTWTASGGSEIHYAVGLAGLGQFGRTPSDLTRWRARFPGVHRGAARLFGLERVNNVEYALAVLVRALSSFIPFSSGVQTIEIRSEDRTERLRLLSGVAMNFPVDAIPFKPEVKVEDEALSVHLVVIARTRHLRIEKNKPLDIRFVDQDHVEFFLDEDPVTTHKRLRLEVAGSIAFVPGPDYR